MTNIHDDKSGKINENFFEISYRFLMCNSCFSQGVLNCVRRRRL